MNHKKEEAQSVQSVGGIWRNYMKQVKNIFLLITLSTVALFIVACSGPSLTIEIPPEKLQEQLDTKFPIAVQEQDASVPLDIVLSDPELILEEGNDKLGFRVTVAITMPDMPVDGESLPADSPSLPSPPKGGPSGKVVRQQNVITGKVTVFSSLRYDTASKAIYISDPDVTELDFEMLPEELVEPLSMALEEVLAEQFATDPIYLPQDEALVQAATAVLKSIRVEDGKLLIEFGL